MTLHAIEAAESAPDGDPEEAAPTEEPGPDASAEERLRWVLAGGDE